MRTSVFTAMGLALFGAGMGADAPTRAQPVRVCEIMADLAAWRGKAVAVLGRFSFREKGRYLSEQACESPPSAAALSRAYTLMLAEDPAGGPKLPDGFDVDQAAVGRKLEIARKTTSLGKFRFGSIEYDRWAVVYGRVEPAREAGPGGAGAKPDRSGLDPASPRLSYRGDGAIFFIVE